MNLPVLYSFRRCPYAMRARLAIKYSDIEVELREVKLKEMPASLTRLSTDKTVPLLLLPDGSVIEESWDIMKWAINNNDPDNYLGSENSNLQDAEMLVETNDYSFKDDLDHYKYADRHPDHTMEHYRSAGEEFLLELEKRLTATNYLSSDSVSISDIAIFPFIRQFAHVDKNWFSDAPYPRLQAWLNGLLDSDLFISVMSKNTVWNEGDDPVRF